MRSQSELSKLLKNEPEEIVTAAAARFRSIVDEVRSWCTKNAKALNGPRGKLEATEKLMAALSTVAEEAAISKSQMGASLIAGYRPPRFDCGQRLCLLDRTRRPPLWREATVEHGGPLLASVDADGKVVAWGERAVELTGTSQGQAMGREWADVLAGGTDEMEEDTRRLGRRVLTCEAEANAAAGGVVQETACVPLKVSPDKSMVIVPLLLRSTAPASSDSAAAPTASAVSAAAPLSDGALVVIEASTALHRVRFDGDAACTELLLDALNHAPLCLPSASYDEAISRHLLDTQLECTTLRDAVTGGRHSVLAQLLPLRMVGAPVSLSLKEVADGKVALDTSGVADCRALCDRLNAGYRANLAVVDQPHRRASFGVLLSGQPGSGKSTALWQLAACACSSLSQSAPSAAASLVPILVPCALLACRARANMAAFASAWNFVDAWLMVEHGASSERYLALSQALMSRRCLVLLDGIDAAGELGAGLPSLAVQVAALLHQGHVVVATTRSDGPGREPSELSGASAAREACEAIGLGSAALHHFETAALSEESQRALLQHWLAAADGAKFLQPALRFATDELDWEQESAPERPSPMGSPLMLSLLAGVFSLPSSTSSNASYDSLPQTVGDFYAAALDAVLLREPGRPPPPGNAALAAQREVLEGLGLAAHVAGSPQLTEDRVVGTMQGRLELHDAWAALRRRLACGSLPLLRVVRTKPLEVRFADAGLQDYLAASAICRGSWPPAAPKPWAWSPEWRAVARIGCEEATVAAFGASLLSASKADVIPLKWIEGDIEAVTLTIGAMAKQAAATQLPHEHKKLLSFRTDTHKDVFAAITASGGEEAGVRRLPDFGLSEVPLAGFAVFLSLLVSDASVTSLDLSKNGLRAEHGAPLARSALASSSSVSRLSLERNQLGDGGVQGLATSLAAVDTYTLEDLDLTSNGLGVEAGGPVGEIIRRGHLRRLVLTTNALGADGSTTGIHPIADALKSDASLRELHLRANQVGSAAGAILGKALAANRALELLSLWKNALAGEGFKALMSGLQSNVTLTHCDLRANSLDDEAGLAVASYVTRRNRLSTLLLSDNALGPESGKALAKAWMDNNVLASVDLRANKLDRDAVAKLSAAKNAAAKKRPANAAGPQVELFVDDVAD